MRALLILGAMIASAIVAYVGQPLMHGNSDAIVIIITVMTVFAGFLVAIITILGDPALIPKGSWRIAEVRRDSIEARLTRHAWLFVLYLVAIALLFAGALLSKALNSVVSITWKTWIERLYLFFSVASFLFTSALPASLLKLQIGRIDAEIERRRKEEGMRSEGGSG